MAPRLWRPTLTFLSAGELFHSENMLGRRFRVEEALLSLRSLSDTDDKPGLW